MAKRGWKDAFEWAKSQLNGVNMNDPTQIQNIISKNGGTSSTVEEALKWGKRIAKGAKLIGANPLKPIGLDLNKIDIDGLENLAREKLLKQNVSTQQQNNNYPPYDRRSMQTYNNTQRASSLPD